MVSEHTPDPLQLRGLIEFPREDLGVEYKNWLDLTSDEARATLAKAAIAMANHGGGFIVLGFSEANGTLESVAVPSGLPTIGQDRVNQAVHRYAEPSFHCELHWVEHPPTGTIHAVVRVPGTDVPVMSKSDHQAAGLAHRKIYVRKPGPRSEEPNTSEEWRQLIDRCIQRRKEEMLNAIRGIVIGQLPPQPSSISPLDDLLEFCAEANVHWAELVSKEPEDSPSRFSYGYFGGLYL